MSHRQHLCRLLRVIVLSGTLAAARLVAAPSEEAVGAHADYPAATYSQEKLIQRIDQLARGRPPKSADLETEFGLKFSRTAEATGRPPLGSAAVRLAIGNEATYLTLPLGTTPPLPSEKCLSFDEIQARLVVTGWSITQIEYYHDGRTITERALTLSGEYGRRHLRFDPAIDRAESPEGCPAGYIVITYFHNLKPSERRSYHDRLCRN